MEGYESLRGHVLGMEQETGLVLWGLAVLIRHGVATWLESRTVSESVNGEGHSRMAKYAAPSLEGWQREAVSLLANMAMSSVKRRTA
jgi:hypothetical protein